MRKISPLKVEYVYADAPDSEERLKRAYNRLIDRAIDNILQKRHVDNESTQKYTKVIHERSGRVPHPRRCRQNIKSQKDHNLSDGSKRKTSSNQIWQGLENKQQETNGNLGG